MKHDSKIKLETVYASTPIQAGMIKSLLENAGIHAFLKDDHMGTIFPWHAAPGGAGAVKVLVSSDQLNEAREIVATYESNLAH